MHVEQDQIRPDGYGLLENLQAGCIAVALVPLPSRKLLMILKIGRLSSTTGTEPVGW
jgi:hypothetical protein